MMNRRFFLYRTSAGLAAALVAPGCWRVAGRPTPPRSYDFKPYRPGQTLGPVVQVTPSDGFYTNAYYDVQPWSPSGRLLAVTRLPYQDRITTFGDEADVCVVDLHEQTIRTLYATRSWGYQLGAHPHWGATDRHLYVNDAMLRDDGRTDTVCVRLDLETGEATAFDGPMYDLAPSGASGEAYALGPRIELLNTSQYAYGTPAVDPEAPEALPPGAATEEGLWKTPLREGAERERLLSLADLATALPDPAFYDGGTFYLFHVKLNPQADRMLLVLRCLFPPGVTEAHPEKRGRNPHLLTARPDGSDLQVAVSRERWKEGGHHPTWHPDGRRIVMNLTPPGPEDTLRFCLFEPDGSGFRILSKKFVGSGHPTVTPETRYVLSDAYPFEPMATDAGEVPIRLIDLEAEEERTVCTIFTDVGRFYDVRRYWGPSKLDAHPVWNRDFAQVCFNGAPEGTRQVLIADLRDIV